MHINT